MKKEKTIAIIEDNESLNFALSIYAKKYFEKVYCFLTTSEFYSVCESIPKDSVIFTDWNIDGYIQDGKQVVKKCVELGLRKVFVHSSDQISKEDLVGVVEFFPKGMGEDSKKVLENLSEKYFDI